MVRANVLSLLVGAALVAGCADNPQSLLIHHNNAPGDGCEVPGEISDVYLSNGRLDVSDPGAGFVGSLGYLFTPGVQSGLIGSQANPNDNVILLEGARIELKAVDSDASRALITALGADAKRDRPTSGSILPGGSAGMGFEIVDNGQAKLMRGAIADGESAQIIADVQVYGTVEGTSVESNHFLYPVTICKGCGYKNLGNCADIPSTFQGSGGGVCRPLADGYLECCTDAVGKAVCPAVGTMATTP